jgi:hypothetical protein
MRKRGATRRVVLQAKAKPRSALLGIETLETAGTTSRLPRVRSQAGTKIGGRREAALRRPTRPRTEEPKVNDRRHWEIVWTRLKIVRRTFKGDTWAARQAASTTEGPA